MPYKQAKKEATEKPQQKVGRSDRVRKIVTAEVLMELGAPDDLYRIDVHLYAARKGRVNVWRREMMRPEKRKGFIGAMGEPELVEVTHITDSFFLWLSSTGSIIKSDPPIVKRYE